jgi:polar amino acid transport system substrate-binding protein
MSIWRWGALLCAAWLLHGNAWARKLVLAATEYPPYYSDALDRGGPVAELTLAALRQAGFEVELRFMPWARALKLGEEGSVDGLVGVWRSPEREAKFFYSEPVVANRIVLCRLAGRAPARFTTFEALRPYTVGVVRGYADPPGLAAAGIRTEPVTHDLQNLRKLLAGHLDLVLIDSRVAHYLIQRNLGTEGQRIQCIAPAVQEHPQYLVVSRSTPGGAAIVAAFNDRLQRLRRDGEFQAIVGRWGW